MEFSLMAEISGSEGLCDSATPLTNSGTATVAYRDVEKAQALAFTEMADPYDEPRCRPALRRASTRGGKGAHGSR